jgi:hypothetical protein
MAENPCRAYIRDTRCLKSRYRIHLTDIKASSSPSSYTIKARSRQEFLPTDLLDQVMFPQGK